MKRAMKDYQETLQSEFKQKKVGEKSENFSIAKNSSFHPKSAVNPLHPTQEQFKRSKIFRKNYFKSSEVLFFSMIS